MKKLLFTLLFAVCATIAAFSQISYKVGLLTSLSTDAFTDQSKLAIGSSLIEAGYSVSGKVAATFNTGYLRYINNGEGFSQFPVLLGLKYRMNETFYFGGSAGAAFYNRKHSGASLMWTPHVGAHIKDLSVDIRYLYTVLKPDQLKTTVIVLSYNF